MPSLPYTVGELAESTHKLVLTTVLDSSDEELADDFVVDALAVLLADELVLHRLADGRAELAGLVLARLVLGGDALGLLLVRVNLHEQLLELCERRLILGALSASLGRLVLLHPGRPEVLEELKLAVDPLDDGLSSFGQAKVLNASDDLSSVVIVFHSSLRLYWCSALPLTFAWRVSQALVPEKLTCRSMITARSSTSHFICFSSRTAAGSTSVASTTMGSCRQRDGGRAVR
eukprot:CAMPEP_0185463740 /NCGR_PEP_ID=MMETSP1365-20130426/95381_1 /TAXON_ID=38817 /ORGANISM="Gephyrocapsa oceanica, Strain RCC1303" /LENGTH=231 /DNA_ID=CAMNT_0028070479 /DNA_START=706 /DNA_END=1402 /DNA_ORIENTATION=+